MSFTWNIQKWKKKRTANSGPFLVKISIPIQWSWKRSDINLITPGTQGRNLKKSDWLFQIFQFWLQKISYKWMAVPLSFNILFSIFLLINVLGASLVWAIALSHGFSPALLNIAEKSLWQQCPFKINFIYK